MLSIFFGFVFGNNGVSFRIVFGFSRGISISDHSVFGHGFNDGEEISFFISTFGGDFVFVFESVTHLSGDFKHVSVSANFSGGSRHNNRFFVDTVVHVIDVVSELDFESGEFSEGVEEVSRDGVEFFLVRLFLSS